MKMSDLKCRKCGKNAQEIAGVGYLKRVNPKGEVPAIWECDSDCSKPRPLIGREAALMKAIKGE